MAEYFIVQIYHILYVHLSTDGHLGCCHFGDFMTKAAVSVYVEVLCGHVFSLSCDDTWR
jgi:hypothetical protein